jgi:hypothetical protein
MCMFQISDRIRTRTRDTGVNAPARGGPGGIRHSGDGSRLAR